MACYTHEEIGEQEGLPKQTVTDILSTLTDFGNLSESGQLLANHQTDYTRPLYKVWK